MPLSSSVTLDFYSPFMERTLDLAQKAFENKEIPVGALLWCSLSQKMFLNHNRTQECKNPLCHGEALVIEEALKAKMGPYLSSSILYVNLQPCQFCQEMILKTRISRVYFGAYQYTKALENLYCPQNSFLPTSLSIGKKNPYPTVFQGGFYESKSIVLLKKFFQETRNSKIY